MVAVSLVEHCVPSFLRDVAALLCGPFPLNSQYIPLFDSKMCYQLVGTLVKADNEQRLQQSKEDKTRKITEPEVDGLNITSFPDTSKGDKP